MQLNNCFDFNGTKTNVFQVLSRW